MHVSTRPATYADFFSMNQYLILICLSYHPQYSLVAKWLSTWFQGTFYNPACGYYLQLRSAFKMYMIHSRTVSIFNKYLNNANAFVQGEKRKGGFV